MLHAEKLERTRALGRRVNREFIINVPTPHCSHHMGNKAKTIGTMVAETLGTMLYTVNLKIFVVKIFS